MTDKLCEYIPHYMAKEYHNKGWDIQRMPGNHGHYSVLATKDIKGWVRVGYLARQIVERLRK